MNLLAGKVAVITGGTRGLGLAIAQAYAEAGATVFLASRSQVAVDQAVGMLTARGYRASGMAVDVSVREQVQALADLALKQFGRLDIWVNNAGIAGPYGPTMGFPPQTFYQLVNTNILGVYNGSHVAMKLFLVQGSGKLINLLGHGYNSLVPWQNAYGSSKAWVRSFTLTLAKETKESGVGVYAFNPGMVLTDLLTDVEVISGSERRLERFPAVVRMWAKPPEIPAARAVWLASQATDGKTGLLVNVFSPWLMLSGVLCEWLRRILRKPVPPSPVNITIVPPQV